MLNHCDTVYMCLQRLHTLQLPFPFYSDAVTREHVTQFPEVFDLLLLHLFTRQARHIWNIRSMAAVNLNLRVLFQQIRNCVRGYRYLVGRDWCCVCTITYHLTLACMRRLWFWGVLHLCTVHKDPLNEGHDPNTLWLWHWCYLYIHRSHQIPINLAGFGKLLILFTIWSPRDPKRWSLPPSNPFPVSSWPAVWSDCIWQPAQSVSALGASHEAVSILGRSTLYRDWLQFLLNDSDFSAVELSKTCDFERDVCLTARHVWNFEPVYCILL